MVRVKRREMRGQASRGKAPVAAGLAGNERGMVLVLALMMLALLTILGAWVLDSSKTDLKIAGNSKNTQNAFYSADAALAYAANPSTLKTAQLSTQGTSTTKWSQVISVGTFTANVTVEYLGSGPLPAGFIFDSDLSVEGTKFHGIYFSVNTEGMAENKAAEAEESGVVQVEGN